MDLLWISYKPPTKRFTGLLSTDYMTPINRLQDSYQEILRLLSRDSKTPINLLSRDYSTPMNLL